MPRRPRFELSGVVFHVMNRAVRGTRLIVTNQDFEALARIMREELVFSSIEVVSYQIMDNHWHFVMTCRRIRDLSTFMHNFTGRHANNWAGAHRARGRGAVYQGRFKAVPVQTSHSLFRVCRYVERNALRKNLVSHAEHWSWGSLHARCNDYYPIPLAKWPIAPPANWVDLVNTPQTEKELIGIRRAIERDRPIGDPRWVRAVAPFVGLTLKRVGRPKK